MRAGTDQPDITIDRLRGFRLPLSCVYRRDHVVPQEWRSDAYSETFDDRTLFYDCTYLKDRQAYLFTAPRFDSLWPVFREGLRLDGQRVRGLRRRRSGRSAQVFLPAPNGRLSLDLDGEHHPLEVRPCLTDRFRQLNCAITVNKNNDLDWIRDWIRYHISAHRLNGVVIFDNGSDAYAPEDIANVLRTTDGLKSGAVISAPYLWGTAVQGPTGREHTKFLQTALINLARLDMAAESRAVLSADIDELVFSKTGESVFDAAANRRLTYLKIGGDWIFPAPATSGPTKQSAHVYRPTPVRRCQPKWCAAPSAWLSRNGWNVHNVGAGPGKYMPLNDRFALLHCSATTTGWKPQSARFRMPESLSEDPELDELMARHLPEKKEQAE